MTESGCDNLSVYCSLYQRMVMVIWLVETTDWWSRILKAHPISDTFWYSWVHTKKFQNPVVTVTGWGASQLICVSVYIPNLRPLNEYIHLCETHSWQLGCGREWMSHSSNRRQIKARPFNEEPKPFSTGCLESAIKCKMQGCRPWCRPWLGTPKHPLNAQSFSAACFETHLHYVPFFFTCFTWCNKSQHQAGTTSKKYLFSLQVSH